MSGNTTYFIGLTNNISGQENVTVKVNKSDTAYKWKINSTTYTTNEPLYLTRGASYTVKFYINDVLCNTPIYPEVIAPHTNIFGGYGNTTLIDGVLTIPANAPVGGSGLYINALSQLDPDADIRHKLTIVPSISSTISFSGAYHSANDMGFKWIHQKYINSVTYTLTRGSVTISGLVRGNLYNTAHDTILSESILARAIASFSSLTGNITVTITSINYRTALGTYVDLGMSRSLSFNPSYAGGSGTASSPYQLTNAFHVNEIRNRTSSRFALMNNISLSAYSNWQPIPYFYGGINGNNYTLQNLKIIVPTTSYSEYQKFGLIGSNSGTIENLKFSNVSLLGSPLHSGAWVYLAAVAGYNNAGGVIKYVYVQGQIELHRTYSRVGGIAGANFGLIEHCDFGNNSVQSLIKGNGDLGGISGSNQGTVTYCNLYYSNIESYITYSNRNIGGIIGYCYNSGMISYSNVYNSEIRNIGWDNNLSDLAPCMGIIVGQIVDSYLWYVGRSNAGVSTGSLNSTQRRYCATGYWGESGYRSNTDVK